MAKDGYLQGYNAQAVGIIDQFVIAVEVTDLAMDAAAYAPMIAVAKNLWGAGEERRVRRPTTGSRLTGPVSTRMGQVEVLEGAGAVPSWRVNE